MTQRILFINPSGSLGGAERSMTDLLDSLLAHGGVEISVLLFASGPLQAELAHRQLTVQVLSLPAPLLHLGEGMVAKSPLKLLVRLVASAASLLSFLPRLRRAVEEIRPDMVHSNGIKAHVLMSLAGIRTPIVWHIRDFIGQRPLMAKVLRLVAHRATGAVAVSRAVRDDANRVLGSLPILAMYDGIDVHHFGHVARTSRHGPGPLRVGLVGTFARWKGHDVFLRAAQKLVHISQRGPSIRFYVIGGPIYDTMGSQFTLAELQNLVEQLDLARFVEFVPFQADPADAYRLIDVVVHASTMPEPFGRTIVEGMASARAVIAMRAGGAAELFTDGVDALGATPGSVDELAAAIERVANDAELRQRLAEGGHRAVQQRFERTRLAPELLDFYREIAPHRHAVPRP